VKNKRPGEVAGSLGAEKWDNEFIAEFFSAKLSAFSFLCAEIVWRFRLWSTTYLSNLLSQIYCRGSCPHETLLSWIV